MKKIGMAMMVTAWGGYFIFLINSINQKNVPLRLAVFLFCSGLVLFLKDKWISIIARDNSTDEKLQRELEELIYHTKEAFGTMPSGLIVEFIFKSLVMAGEDFALKELGKINTSFRISTTEGKGEVLKVLSGFYNYFNNSTTAKAEEKEYFAKYKEGIEIILKHYKSAA